MSVLWQLVQLSHLLLDLGDQDLGSYISPDPKLPYSLVEDNYIIMHFDWHFPISFICTHLKTEQVIHHLARLHWPVVSFQPKLLLDVTHLTLPLVESPVFLMTTFNQIDLTKWGNECKPIRGTACRRYQVKRFRGDAEFCVLNATGICHIPKNTLHHTAKQVELNIRAINVWYQTKQVCIVNIFKRQNSYLVANK